MRLLVLTPKKWQKMAPGGDVVRDVHCIPVHLTLRSGDSLLPIPLYRNPPRHFNGDHKTVLKWQTEWQACDEVQMGGCRAEHATL